MDARDAIRILSEFNRWRRGEPPYDKPGAPFTNTPAEIGEAIDVAVGLLSGMPSGEGEGTKFDPKEYYERILKDPDVRRIFRERHGYDLDSSSDLDKPAHWTFLAYDEACCSNCGHVVTAPFDTTDQARESWGELPKFCEDCGARMDLSARVGFPKRRKGEK